MTRQRTSGTCPLGLFSREATGYRISKQYGGLPFLGKYARVRNNYLAQAGVGLHDRGCSDARNEFVMQVFWSIPLNRRHTFLESSVAVIFVCRPVSRYPWRNSTGVGPGKDPAVSVVVGARDDVTVMGHRSP